QRLKAKLGLRAGQFNNELGQLADGELVGIADVDRTGHIRRGLHHPNKRLDEIVDITKRARLRPFPVDGDVVTLQSLHNKIRHYATVIRVHMWTISIEDPYDFDRHIVLPPIVEEYGLRASFSLVVARPPADRVDLAPVFLRL